MERHFPAALRVARTALKAPYLRYCFNRPPSSLSARGAFTRGELVDDRVLIDRLIASYRQRREAPTGLWSEIFLDRHRDIEEAIAQNDRARIEEILRNPVTSDLMYGFDSTAKSLRAGGLRIEDRRAPALTLDSLVTLAEAIRARRIDYPENYYVGRIQPIDVDPVLDAIEKTLGFTLSIPNPYPAEYGLSSKRGVISYRVPQAIYQAWRMSQLVAGKTRPKVLEIGAGLGRTALYAWHFGIKDYTIVDIPISSLAQGYFLGRTVGPDNIVLAGEAASADKIKVLAPSAFLDGNERYDLVVNVDSLTEIGRTTAEQYWQAIRERAAAFLSINHEANDFTVAELIGDREVNRSPYWLRRGYTEEVVTF
jgi:hypothetical protein